MFDDDILFLYKPEAELQALLNITGDFDTKWNLKCISDKSKVKMIRIIIDHNKEWSLDSNVLKETNEYKHIGVYFSRSLNFSYHINCYLTDTSEKKV